MFAAKARHFSGCIPEHTRIAMHALGNCTVEAASALADDVAVGAVDGDATPAYEVWRRNVRGRVAGRTPSRS